MSDLQSSARRPLAIALALLIVATGIWGVVGAAASPTALGFLLTASAIAFICLLIVTLMHRRNLLVDCVSFLLATGALAVGLGFVAVGAIKVVLIAAIVVSVVLATISIVLRAEQSSDVSVDRL